MSPKPKEVANWKLKTCQPKWQWAHLADLVTGSQVTSVSVNPQIVKDPHWQGPKWPNCSKLAECQVRGYRSPCTTLLRADRGARSGCP